MEKTDRNKYHCKYFISYEENKKKNHNKTKLSTKEKPTKIKKNYNKTKLSTKEKPTTISSFVKCHHYSLLRIYQKHLNKTGKHCCMLQSMTLQLLHCYHLIHKQVLSEQFIR